MELTAAGVLHIAFEGDGNSRLGLAVAGLVFTVLGAWLAFGRRRMTIDLARGCVARRYELLVPVQNREWLLSDFNAVAILYQAGDSDWGAQYPVRLRSIIGKDLTVISPALSAVCLQRAVQSTPRGGDRNPAEWPMWHSLAYLEGLYRLASTISACLVRH